MYESIMAWLEVPWAKALTVSGGSVMIAYLTEQIICRVVMALAAKTRTELDDKIIAIVRMPIFFTVIFGGQAWSAHVLAMSPPSETWHISASTKLLVFSVLQTAAVLTWVVAGLRIGKEVLQNLSQREQGLVQTRSLPLFDIVLKVLVIGIGTYFALLAWNVNITGWLASAGVLGLVLGLAAKDTLANLFAGLFILADAPYKLGDYIKLDDGLRGRVTDIGVRSTRILTHDDVEITIPNAVIGNSKIVNETGGPHPKSRIRIAVAAAYGDDVERVREVLVSCAKAEPLICDTPNPRVRFRRFGDSGLEFELLGWISEPRLRGRATDRLNVSVYKAFAEAGLEIPFSKHDVYIKQGGFKP